MSRMRPTQSHSREKEFNSSIDLLAYIAPDQVDGQNMTATVWLDDDEFLQGPQNKSSQCVLNQARCRSYRLKAKRSGAGAMGVGVGGRYF